MQSQTKLPHILRGPLLLLHRKRSVRPIFSRASLRLAVGRSRHRVLGRATSTASVTSQFSVSHMSGSASQLVLAPCRAATLGPHFAVSFSFVKLILQKWSWSLSALYCSSIPTLDPLPPSTSTWTAAGNYETNRTSHSPTLKYCTSPGLWPC